MSQASQFCSRQHIDFARISEICDVVTREMHFASVRRRRTDAVAIQVGLWIPRRRQIGDFRFRDHGGVCPAIS
jgi:hypothetical protein